MDFQLRGELIELDNLLKAAGLVASGSEARERILAGAVRVNGQPEIRVRCKVRHGDKVEYAGQRLRIIGKGMKE